ncbi:MAG: DUF4437 domain-containing protein [Alphaproteobacteria bacterium]|nr:DUF4437 domain-containing protein [Alphaproteobacteria bacterium]
MARDHIEFIQAQLIPWRVLPPTTARPGVEMRMLSRDPEIGASSLLLRYPKGFAINEPHYLDNDEEFFVLDGELEIGRTRYGKGSYAYLPDGYPRPRMATPDGALVLTFFEGKHKNVFGGAKDFRKDLLVEKIDTTTAAWAGIVDPKVKGGGLRKIMLREDAKTGERTWILRMGANDPKKVTHSQLEIHPFVEEMLLLDGSISMSIGVLHQGAYFWRPGGVQHGPVGTIPGCTCFFRCKGGPFSTDWTKESYPIDYNAPYDPTLPPDLKAIARPLGAPQPIA